MTPQEKIAFDSLIATMDRIADALERAYPTPEVQNRTFVEDHRYVAEPTLTDAPDPEFDDRCGDNQCDVCN